MAALCPTCRKPALADFTPFCSKRCADVDLNRWFTEGYAIAAVELDDADFAELKENIGDENNPHHG